jgi:hypothetical protein
VSLQYIELIDTFLLALRGKSIPFLHSYHHAATLVLCWSQLWAQSCIQWLPIVINLLVHVVMYGYYALHALRVHIWWKKYLTLLQIVQFVVALCGCILAVSSRIFAITLRVLPVEQYGCWGTYGGAWVGIAIIASYLYLFIVLFRAKYDKKGVASSASSSAAVIGKEQQLQRDPRPTPSTIDEAVANGYAKHLTAYESSNGTSSTSISRNSRRTHQE